MKLLPRRSRPASPAAEPPQAGTEAGAEAGAGAEAEAGSPDAQAGAAAPGSQVEARSGAEAPDARSGVGARPGVGAQAEAPAGGAQAEAGAQAPAVEPGAGASEAGARTPGAEAPAAKAGARASEAEARARAEAPGVGAQAHAVGAAPVIEFRGVGLTYPGPPPVEALHPCELLVRRGEFLTVVGPSGSGKSTFLNVAGLLDSPTTGRYLLDGIDTAALPDRERTALRGRRIGFVFQSFHLLPHRSALENVTLAMLYTGIPRAQRLVRAREALDQVGLGHRAGAVPGRLSGGERQRVAIARALVGRPSLLLCDEPTGNLDSANAASVLGLLDELHGSGMTVLVITHDVEVARRGRRTVTIRDGRLHL